MILIQTEKTLHPLGPKTDRPPEVRRYTFASRLPLGEALKHMGSARRAHQLLHEPHGYAVDMRFIGYQELAEDLDSDALATAMLCLIEETYGIENAANDPRAVEA